MAQLNPTWVLRGFQVLLGALSIVMAQLSRTLIRNSLIPQQQYFMGDIGALFIMVGLLLTLVYWSGIHKRLRTFIKLAGATLIVLLFLQILFVVTVDKYGNPAIPRRFLVGFHLTKQGEELVNKVGANRSREEWIKDIGADRIDTMYGASYYAIAISYSLSYLAFVVGVVVTLGGILKQSGDYIAPLPGAGNPAPAADSGALQEAKPPPPVPNESPAAGETR